jgi:inorganic triphosphatase YgiF
VELELKFDVDEAVARRLLADLPGAGPGKVRTLRAVYFDTPEGLLRRNGMVLRIRDEGDEHIQAVKHRNGGGLARGEWETPVSGDAPDLQAAADTPLTQLCAGRDLAQLAPVFEVRVERTTREISLDGAAVEVAFDTGEVRAGDAASPVCELEIELVDGDRRALFDLARDLAGKAALDLSFTAKADRGYALADVGKPDGGRADADGRRPALDPKSDAASAFRAIALAALAQMAVNARTLRGAPQARCVHQLRVAVRRLRSAITLFGPMLIDGDRESVKAELKWLAGELNDARNLDVFIDETFRPVSERRAEIPGLTAFEASLTAARKRAYRRADAAVRSPRFRRLMLEAVVWVEFGGWGENDLSDSRTLRERPARKAARDVLERCWRKLEKAGRRMDESDHAALHAQRIRAKKLRYACDFFADLYAGGEADRRKAFAEKVAALQDALGQVNDIDTARSLTAKVVQPNGAAARDLRGAYAAGVVMGERQAGEAQAVKAAAKAWRRLRKAERFW